MHAKRTMAFVVLAALVLSIVPVFASDSDALTETLVIDADDQVAYNKFLSDHSTYVSIDINKIGRVSGQDVSVTFDLDNEASLNPSQISTGKRLGTDVYFFSIDFSTVPANGAVTITFNGATAGFNVNLPHNVCLIGETGNIIQRDVGSFVGGTLTITGASQGQYLMYAPVAEDTPYIEPVTEDLTPAVAVAVAGSGAFAILVLVFVLLRKGEL